MVINSSSKSNLQQDVFPQLAFNKLIIFDCCRSKYNLVLVIRLVHSKY